MNRSLHVAAVWILAGLVFAGLGGCGSAEMRRGDRFAAEGNWDAAVAAYRQALRKSPFDEGLQKRLTEAKAHAAEQHYSRGRQLLKDNLVHEALKEFQQAAGLDPAMGEHHEAVGDAMRLKEARDHLQAADKLRSLGHYDEALETYERAVHLDPTLTPALEAISALTEQQRDEKLLGGSGQPITLRFQNSRLKEVFEILSRAGGVNLVLDKDVRDDPVTIFLKDTPFEEALQLLLTTNNLFSKQIAPDTLLIAPNNRQKQDQYQDLMIRTFYLSNVKAKDMLTLLRTMLETKRISINEPVNAIVMRDRPEKLQMAERIILANDRRDPEVLLDVEVLEVNRSKLLQWGITYGKQATGTLLSGNEASGSFTLTQLKHLAALGTNSWIFTIPNSVTLDLLKTEAEAKTLASPKLRVLNNKKAEINIGDKQPILLSTSNVLPGTAVTGATPTTSTVTSIEFKDVGVKLKVEPTIHLTNEVTLNVKIEVTRVGEQVELQASPRIAQFKFGTRTAETILNVKDDESVVLAGLIQDEDRKQRSTVPILGDIPFLGDLLSSWKNETTTTEVILTITPHIIRSLTMPDITTQAFWSGTEGNYTTEPLFSPLARKTSTKSRARPADLPAGPAPPGPQGGGSLGAAPPLSGSTDAAGTAPALEAGPLESGEGGSDQVAGGATRLALRPGEISAPAGQEVQIELSVDNLAALTDSALTLLYNPNLLLFRGAKEGELLTRGGARGSVSAAGNPAGGIVTLRLQRQGEPVSGQGILATLQFQAKAAGIGVLEIQDASITGPDAKPMPIRAGRAVVRVR